MKISEIIYEEFKTAPTLSEFVDFIEKTNWYKIFKDEDLTPDENIVYADREEMLMIYNYNRFLKQPIELKMLVPCKDGEVFKEPKEPEPPYNDMECDIWLQYEIYNNRYQKAKEDVLFSGFEIKKRIGNTFTLRYEEDEFSQDYINWNDNTKEMSIITACHLDTFFECDTFETLEGLTGQPITENYFKFLD